MENGCDGDVRGNEYFSVPKHTPIIFSEVGGRNVCRLLVKDAVGETESALLSETVPSWVTNVVIERTIPKFIKLPFYLLAHPSMLKQDRSKKVSSVNRGLNSYQIHCSKFEKRVVLERIFSVFRLVAPHKCFRFVPTNTNYHQPPTTTTTTATVLFYPIYRKSLI